MKLLLRIYFLPFYYYFLSSIIYKICHYYYRKLTLKHHCNL
nr:MAG TPA: hypothetical protein [Caudoviricetes sp.]